MAFSNEKDVVMTNLLPALMFAIVSVAALPAWAADPSADVTDLQALRNAVKTDKKAFIAATVHLTPDEEKKFWPIYDAYQRSVERSNRRRVVVLEQLISREQQITDLYAKNLANELIASDEAEVKARRTMQNRMLRALPARKAARYMQLESKIRAAQEYDIAATIPLID